MKLSRCPHCRVVLKHNGGGEHECPECGYTETVTVSELITTRTPEPFNPRAFFQQMRREVDKAPDFKPNRTEPNH